MLSLILAASIAAPITIQPTSVTTRNAFGIVSDEPARIGVTADFWPRAVLMTFDRPEIPATHNTTALEYVGTASKPIPLEQLFFTQETAPVEFAHLGDSYKTTLAYYHQLQPDESGTSQIVYSGFAVAGQYDDPRTWGEIHYLSIFLRATPISQANNPVWIDYDPALFRFTSYTVGDLNNDDLLNNLDIDPFTNILLEGSYDFRSDFDHNGSINNLDIDPFAGMLARSASLIVPEPPSLPILLFGIFLLTATRGLLPCSHR